MLPQNTLQGGLELRDWKADERVEEGGGWTIRRLPPPNLHKLLIRMKPYHPRYSQFNTGQELVEFTLVLLVLVLIAFGVLDLGRSFNAAVTVENAARVGARYGTFHWTDDNNDGIPDNASDIITETRNEAQNSGVPLTISNSNVEVICPDPTITNPNDPNYDVPIPCTPGNPIRVRVTYHFPLVMGFVLPSPVDIVGQAEMVIP